MKKTWLYSIVGVVALLVILVAVNLLGNVFRLRSDLTQHHLYTLSEGTRKILSKIDSDVEIRFYFSKDNASMPVPLRTYAQQVQDLLTEYEQAGRGHIKVKKLDPKPDSDAEDSANLDGIEGQTTNLTDRVYLGLAVSSLDAKATIPFLSPDREHLLEYDISRAISSVVNPKKSVIGIMSPLPVLGQSSPMMMMQRQQASGPWVFLSELKENYQVQSVPLTADKIDDNISVLLLVHPKGLSEQAQYAVDQFVLRGGRLVALLDPLSFVDTQLSGQGGMMGGESFSSNLPKLLSAWGLTFTQNQVVGDELFATQIQRDNGGSSSPDPTILSITSEGINQKDPLGAATSDLLLPFCGAFTGQPAAGLKEETLITSSAKAGLVDTMAAQMGADAVRKSLQATNKYTLGLRLSGRFKTAFPNGKPAAPKETNPAGTAAATPSPSPAAASAPALKEGKADAVVILVGDSDFVYDGIAGRVENVLNQTVFVPANGNLNFIESCLEELAGDSNLIGIRSRGTASRPFVVVNRLEAAAQQKYQSKINQLETNLTETREKLSEIQSGKQADQKTVLSPEQQAEIKKFQETEATTNRELKQVRKDLRQEIDSLQNDLKWINLLAMPLAVTLLGLVLAGVKQRNRAAR